MFQPILFIHTIITFHLLLYISKDIKANIATLKAKNLDSLISEDEKTPIIWLMSPPCQPYTRQGKQEDVKDPRAKPILNLMEIFSSLVYKPNCILLENVKNFEISESCKIVKETLVKNEYNIKEGNFYGSDMDCYKLLS